MRKLFVTIMALADGKASIEPVGKSSISRAPGDVTEIRHN